MKKSFPPHVSVLMLALAAAVFVPQVHAQQSAPAKAPTFKAHELTRAEFDALLTHPEKLLLIDLRRPDELANIGGFPVYLSIQNVDLEKSLNWIPKDRTIVTISNHTGRSGQAADLLASRGFKVAGLLGARTYEEHGGKLTKIAPPPEAQTAGTAASGAR